MIRFALAVLIATPLFAQDSLLFPRFSITAGSSAGEFETNARIDPDDGATSGTLVSFERDLGLEDSKTLPRFGLQWRPLARHELAAIHFTASREGFEEIDREIVFRDEVYPVQARVTTDFDLDYWSATYTYWARRGPRDGFGLTIGLATLAFDASVIAERPDASVTISQEANTDVPVALAGAQGRSRFSIDCTARPASRRCRGSRSRTTPAARSPARCDSNIAPRVGSASAPRITTSASTSMWKRRICAARWR